MEFTEGIIREHRNIMRQGVYRPYFVYGQDNAHIHIVTRIDSFAETKVGERHISVADVHFFNNREHGIETANRIVVACNFYPAALDTIAQQQAEIGRLRNIADRLYSALRPAHRFMSIETGEINWERVRLLEEYAILKGGAG